ncbi:MAG: helix-turn-helix domain-containing protein [Gammaproteobacteria bacterium]|nr:helix-turn-helix domain-containing protein [Gammaproteobacteria bacterium]
MTMICVIGATREMLCQLDDTFDYTTLAYDADCEEALRQSGVCLYYHDPQQPLMLRQVLIIKKRYPSLPIIVFSFAMDEYALLTALRARAWDYVVLPAEIHHLREIIDEVTTLKHLASGKAPRQIYFPARTGDQPHIALRKPWKTSRAAEYIIQNYSGKIRVTALARLCNMSQAVFSKCFKREHGASVREFLLLYRIGLAKELLANTDKKVDVVAYDVGFDDASYFIRNFKKLEKLTPRAYREKLADPGPAANEAYG